MNLRGKQSDRSLTHKTIFIGIQCSAVKINHFLTKIKLCFFQIIINNLLRLDSTNDEIIGRVLKILNQGLIPFIVKSMLTVYGEK
jgi:hypothetical protein